MTDRGTRRWLPNSRRGWIRAGLVLVFVVWTTVRLIPAAVQTPSVIVPVVGIMAFVVFQVLLLARVDRLTEAVARLEREERRRKEVDSPPLDSTAS